MSTTSGFAAAVPSRSVEDLKVGERRKSRSRLVTEQEIVDFARVYDPQWFHTDPELAKASVFGEVVASGIHVLAMWRQLDHEINSDIDYVCGVGWDDLRLKQAVRAGDVIHVTSEIIEVRPSRSKSDRGIAVTRYAVVKETGEEAVSFLSTSLVYTRARLQGATAG